MYTVRFYNTGYVKEGFRCVPDALAHIIQACFEGCVEDEAGEVLVSWSPINGMKWYNVMES
jgi:hypothetical protein